MTDAWVVHADSSVYSMACSCRHKNRNAAGLGHDGNVRNFMLKRYEIAGSTLALLAASITAPWSCSQNGIQSGVCIMFQLNEDMSAALAPRVLLRPGSNILLGKACWG